MSLLLRKPTLLRPNSFGEWKHSKTYTTPPVGGADQDYRSQDEWNDPAVRLNRGFDQLYRNEAGVWKDVGILHPWVKQAKDQGFSKGGNFVTFPSLATLIANGKLTVLGTDGTISGSYIQWTGGANPKSWEYLANVNGPLEVWTNWNIDALPVGGGYILGCGSYYGAAYPSVQVAASGQTSILGLTTTGMPVVTPNDRIFMYYGFGHSVIMIYDSDTNAVSYQMAVTGSFWDPSWAAGYGFKLGVDPTGLLSAGKVTLSSCKWRIA